MQKNNNPPVEATYVVRMSHVEIVDTMAAVLITATDLRRLARDELNPTELLKHAEQLTALYERLRFATLQGHPHITRLVP